MQARAAAFQRMSSTSELLPEPETPVTADDDAERQPHIEVPEVVVPGPSMTIAGAAPRFAGRRLVGTGIASLPLK